MKKVNNTESGFTINNLILVESSFRRIENVDFSDTVENELNIGTEVAVQDNDIIVAETVTIVQKNEEKEQVNVRVKMVGMFKKVGASDITDLEEFGRVNGAAIIYPYIREHITNLSIKAGIGAIILPPVNFTNANQQKK